jgi:hypothetical protein
MNQRRGRLRIRRWWIARTRRDQSTTSAMPTGPTFRKLDLRSASEDSEIGESIGESSKTCKSYHKEKRRLLCSNRLLMNTTKRTMIWHVMG